MLKGIRGIDHAVILVRDLDRARDDFCRLGFTLTPRGFHSLGSQNHCIMFGRDYLELMALPRPHPAFQYFSDFLASGEGVGALALASDDAHAAHAAMIKAGIPAESPLALSRPVDGAGDARFTLVQLAPSATPGFRTFVCEHHTREVVWRPEFVDHLLGATGLAEVIAVAEGPPAYPPFLAGLPFTFLPEAQAQSRLAGLLEPRPRPGIVALRIAVGDLRATEQVLRARGQSPMMLPDRSIALRAADMHGVALVFSGSGL